MSDRGGLSLPAAPQPIPGFPSNFRPLPFEGYETLNVKAPRPAISPKEVSWMDGWMPLSESNARILPDAGDTFVSATGGTTVVWMGFGNVKEVNFGYALLSNGALMGFDTDTGQTFATLFAGSIENPSSVFGISQWGNKYQLFCKDQTNGYWVIDGSNVFAAGGVSPEIDVTNAGLNYTSAPVVTVQTTGGGINATYSATILNGSVTEVTCTNPGSGFERDDSVNLIFTGGGTDDQATATVAVSPNTGGVTEIIVTDPGSGYTIYATVQLSGGGGFNCTAYPVIQSGAIVSIVIVNRGTQFTSPPTVTINDPGYGSGSSHVSGGSGFVGFALIDLGEITFIGVDYGGTNYTSPPTVLILGDGVGCTAVASIANGVVSSITVTNGGSGYTVALASLQGGNNAANATTAVFPWGISGTTIETNQSRVWIANGGAVSDTPPKDRVIFSDPSTPVGFGNGGGGFRSNDSFLKVGYHWLKQTNGFLYLGGDSSTNYISGVSTTTAAATATTPAGPPITTFSNLNVDPQIGSPWPASIQVLSRNIVIANPQGIFVSYGGAMTKISEPIDPLYASCPNLSGTANYSSAVATIFGVQVYMLLLPVFDPFAGAVVNKLIMYDGKRLFTSQQSKTLTFIATQEINGVLTAWGTDGTNIFKLFQKPSTNFIKRIQSRLSADAGYFLTKTLVRLLGCYQAYISDSPLLISLDNESENSAPTYTIPVTAGGIWTGAGGVVGSWTGASSVPGAWNGNGVNVFGPLPVAQQGRLLGYTIGTTASDVALMSILGAVQDFSTNI